LLGKTTSCNHFNAPPKTSAGCGHFVGYCKTDVANAIYVIIPLPPQTR